MAGVRINELPADTAADPADLIPVFDAATGKTKRVTVTQLIEAVQTAISLGAGSGDVTGPSASSDGEIAVYSGTSGKTIKRSNTLSGLAKLAAGILSAATAGTDYYAPGSTDVAVADGGTGSSTAAGARTALGLVIGTDVEAHDADLTTIAGLTPTNDDIIQRKAGAWINRTMAQLKTDLALTKSDVGLSSVDNLQQMPISYLDTDTTLAANSDVKVASQKAIKAYADGLIAANDAMVFKGVIDCSANPNYPAASAGHTYRVSVAGKIGGASGPNVEAGDILLCLTDGTSAGTHASVGANWSIIQVNVDGALTTAHLGSTVQAYDATLAALAAITTAADKLIYATGVDTFTTTDLTSTARSLLDDTSTSAMRTTLGLVIGTNVQAWDADLDTWATKTAPSGTVVGTTDTQKITNKRRQRRASAVTQSATPAINSDNMDIAQITGLAQAITSMTSSLTGTPDDGDLLEIQITDNGTARAITWGASFAATTVALPTTTVISTRLRTLFEWNAATSKYDCLAVA